MNNVLKDALGGGFTNLFGEGIKIPELPTASRSPVGTKTNSPDSSTLKVDALSPVANLVGSITPGPVPLIPMFQ